MKLETNVPLKELTNLKIGGQAKFFTGIQENKEVGEALFWAKQEKLPVFILGGGTNIVMPDEGFAGLVLHMKNRRIKREKGLLHIEAGTEMAELLETMLQFRLSGLEWAGGLPGTFGGAVRDNSGAFGGEIKDSIASVMVMDRQGKVKRLSNPECQFTYRDSLFKKKPLIILSAVLKLLPCRDLKKSRALIEEKIDFRRKKQPLEFPNVGSIFKNINRPAAVRKIIKLFPSIAGRVQTDWGGKVPTAFLVERAGIKGTILGGAKVSEKHANYIINYGNATAREFVELMGIVQRVIKELFGVVLEPEIEIVRAEPRK